MSDNDKKTILIVDDDLDMREITKVTLGQSDYDFLEAENGQAGLEVLAKNTVDLVLMDAIMPVMDGFDSCIAIKKQAKHKDLPIIMLTSLCDVDSISYAFTSGATDFISKPIVIPLLIQRVNLALETVKLTKALVTNIKNLEDSNEKNLVTWKYDLKNKVVHLSAKLNDLLEVERHKNHSLSDFIRMVDKSNIGDFKEQIKTTLKDRKSNSLELTFITNNDNKLKVKQEIKIVKDTELGYSLLGRIKIEEQTNSQDNDYFKYHDNNTDLPNNLSLEKLLQALTKNNDSMSAAVYISIDKISQINFDYGQAIGNTTIKYVANIINDTCVGKCTVYRYHGNSFVILINKDRDKNWTKLLTKKIQTNIETSSIFIELGNMDITVSTGVAFHTFKIKNIEEMIIYARTEAKKAKHKGGNIVSFFDDITEEKNTQISGQLKNIIETGNLESMYRVFNRSGNQPGNNVTSLKYWLSPAGKNMGFDELSMLANKSNNQTQLGWTIIESAFKELHTIYKKGYLEVTLSLRLTKNQIFNDEIVQFILNACKENAISESQLKIEISESLISNSFDTSMAVLNKMKKNRLNVSIPNKDLSSNTRSTSEVLPIIIFNIDQSSIRDKDIFYDYVDFFSNIAADSQRSKTNQKVESIDNMFSDFQRKAN